MEGTRLLEGKVAIVTGGGRGIGRAHCLELARHGAVVIVNDPGVARDGAASDESPADQVVDEIRRAGGEAMADRGSVTDWEDCQKLVASALASYGRLDVVVNNAGIVRDRTITNMTEEDWDAVVAVHLKGTFQMTKHACDHWRARTKAGERTSGRIINTTSGAGLRGNVGQSAYGAAKAAIASLTVTTALEGQRYGVTANAISPIAATRLSADVLQNPRHVEAPGLDPSLSSPVIAWLASDDSAWLTGQVLRVEGDRLVRMNGWSAAPGAYRARCGERLDVSEIGHGARMLWGTAPQGLTPQLEY